MGGSGRREPPPLSPEAKANIFYLVGECHESSPLVARASPDVLRVGAEGFVEEDSAEVKLAVVGLAVKLSLRRPGDAVVGALCGHVLELARCANNNPTRIAQHAHIR